MNKCKSLLKQKSMKRMQASLVSIMSVGVLLLMGCGEQSPLSSNAGEEMAVPGAKMTISNVVAGTCERCAAGRSAVKAPIVAVAKGPVPISLGKAKGFAVLSQSGITNVFQSAIVGDVGTSPITGAALLLTCGEVSGNVYTVDAAGPLPCAIADATLLTLAVGDMGFAYDDAAGRLAPDFTELGAGEIGGLTLVPGLYKCATSLLISADVTLAGGPDDVWILQVAGNLNQANATRVTLAGGAQAKNIFWQVAGAVSLGTNAHFAGIVLGKTMIAVQTGTSVTGRLLAQTAVTLQMNAITEPAE